MHRLRFVGCYGLSQKKAWMDVGILGDYHEILGAPETGL